MGENYSRRKFLEYAVAGLGSFLLPGYNPKQPLSEKVSKKFNYIEAPNEVIQAVSNNEGTPFASLPDRSNRNKAPGLASVSKEALHVPEKGGTSRIYEILNEYPWVSLKVNGKSVFNGPNPLVSFISHSLWIEDGDSSHWKPNPNFRQAFTLEPSWGSSSGNCFGFHNGYLKEYKTYEGVYENSDGQIFIGLEGFKRKDTHIIGLNRYPLAPNSNDRLVLYPSRYNNNGQIIGTDFTERSVSFKCVEAKLLPAAEGDKKGWWNEDPNSLYLLSCYPPEYSELEPPPPGRLLMKLKQVK